MIILNETLTSNLRNYLQEISQTVGKQTNNNPILIYCLNTDKTTVERLLKEISNYMILHNCKGHLDALSIYKSICELNSIVTTLDTQTLSPQDITRIKLITAKCNEISTLKEVNEYVNETWKITKELILQP